MGVRDVVGRRLRKGKGKGKGKKHRGNFRPYKKGKGTGKEKLSDEEKKQLACFHEVKAQSSCPYGKQCAYSHDHSVVSKSSGQSKG